MLIAISKTFGKLDKCFIYFTRVLRIYKNASTGIYSTQTIPDSYRDTIVIFSLITLAKIKYLKFSCVNVRCFYEQFFSIKRVYKI